MMLKRGPLHRRCREQTVNSEFANGVGAFDEVAQSGSDVGS